MGNITDIGFLVEPKQVRLVEGGTVYKLPPDVPVPLMLYLEHHAEQEITTELVEDLYAQTLGLFQVYQPDLESLPIGLTQMLTLVRHVYSQEPDPEPDEAPGPPTKAAGTKSTSARRKRPASRSSS